MNLGEAVDCFGEKIGGRVSLAVEFFVAPVLAEFFNKGMRFSSINPCLERPPTTKPTTNLHPSINNMGRLDVNIALGTRYNFFSYSVC